MPDKPQVKNIETRFVTEHSKNSILLMYMLKKSVRLALAE